MAVEVVREVVLEICNETHARLLVDGLEDHWGAEFRVRKGGSNEYPCVIEVVTSVQGVRLVNELVLDQISNWAAGFNAALRAHCAL